MRCLGITLAAVTLGGAVPSAAGPHPGPGVVATPEVVPEPSVAAGRTCEPIRVELCRSAVRGYNMTIMPNLAGHEFQKEAEGHLSTFAPLVQYGCSSQLLLFLCAVLVPMCTDQVDQVELHAHGQASLGEVHVVAIGPCRGLCEAVRSRCLPVLLNFSYPWPPHLDCARFPAHNSPAHMCMEGPGEDDDARGFPLVVAAVPEHPASPTLPGVPTGALPSRCAEALPHFSRADKQMAEVWLSIWSGLCFVSSVLALLTLRLGPGPGQRPTPGPSGRPAGARTSAGPSPLASLALSYGLLSVGWGTRVLAGRSTSASALASAVAAECDASDLRNPNCAAVFLLTYFFGTASIIWWVVLAAVWFLSAGLRMSPGSLLRHSYLFHLAGWGVPAALTLGVLVLRDVAAEPLTGTCQVGPTWSTVFVLAPQCAFLCMGLLFLALGALTQWRSKPPPAPQALLWPLAAERLGLLAGLCALPLAVLVATHALELGTVGTASAASMPHLSLRLFQVRLVASLVVGVAAPFWVWPGERPWPPCPPWPRPPRAWRFADPTIGSQTSILKVMFG
ncbi:frizzled-4-like [Thrips palmi]|uniref:Frizzled-4-like n=1 Tax=Thrips palmi TaxID=161013 RepID=A0A6P8Y8P5_THRPL|nr:frizzled-4-like [Thrips palmi]